MAFFRQLQNYAIFAKHFPGPFSVQIALLNRCMLKNKNQRVNDSCPLQQMNLYVNVPYIVSLMKHILPLILTSIQVVLAFSISVVAF